MYDNKQSLIDYIKYETEEENIEIITNKSVHSINFYDKKLSENISKIWNSIQENEELILGVKSYS